ncbi:hypothetical protein TNCV_146641 [Trichonephila clavipes]|nr:hypothetical protein TNCV_146641 [Trichonephila clavipes]
MPLTADQRMHCINPLHTSSFRHLLKKLLDLWVGQNAPSSINFRGIQTSGTFYVPPRNKRIRTCGTTYVPPSMKDFMETVDRIRYSE